MNYSAIAVRYAKALFSLAKEKNALSKVRDDMAQIVSVCEQDETFNRFLENPVLPFAKKNEIFDAIFKKQADKLTLDFIHLVTQNRREAFLKYMALDFLNLYKLEKGIKTVHFSSVTKINDTVRKEIRDLIKNSFNAETELIETTNENLVGGFLIRIDDLQYDASVARQLETIKREIVK